MYDIFNPHSDTGFCSYEVEDNDHGVYKWNETHGGETDIQVCVFGSKTGYPNKATRYCGFNGWMEYNGDACISRATHKFQLLREVHLQVIFNIAH